MNSAQCAAVLDSWSSITREDAGTVAYNCCVLSVAEGAVQLGTVHGGMHVSCTDG